VQTACEIYINNRTRENYNKILSALNKLDEARSNVNDPLVKQFGIYVKKKEYYEILHMMPFLPPNYSPAFHGECKPYLKSSRSISNFFNSASIFTPHRDPLTLDLDGDGIETVGTDAGVLFDHDNDGVKTGTGWVDSDDGFLVYDRNGDGVINNGNELFGDNTIKSDGNIASNGFDALRDLDSNNDNVINSSDDNWDDLKVWRDLNQDGFSQSNELTSLDDLNIASICTRSTDSSRNLPGGNSLDETGLILKQMILSVAREL